MSEGDQSKSMKLNPSGSSCRLVAMDTSTGVFSSEDRPDPYVIRAKERAKSKIRTRIMGMNGGT